MSKTPPSIGLKGGMNRDMKKIGRITPLLAVGTISALSMNKKIGGK